MDLNIKVNSSDENAPDPGLLGYYQVLTRENSEELIQIIDPITLEQTEIEAMLSVCESDDSEDQVENVTGAIKDEDAVAANKDENATGGDEEENATGGKVEENAAGANEEGNTTAEGNKIQEEEAAQGQDGNAGAEMKDIIYANPGPSGAGVTPQGIIFGRPDLANMMKMSMRQFQEQYGDVGSDYSTSTTTSISSSTSTTTSDSEEIFQIDIEDDFEFEDENLKSAILQESARYGTMARTNMQEVLQGTGAMALEFPLPLSAVPEENGAGIFVNEDMDCDYLELE